MKSLTDYNKNANGKIATGAIITGMKGCVTHVDRLYYPLMDAVLQFEIIRVSEIDDRSGNIVAVNERKFVYPFPYSFAEKRGVEFDYY